MDAFSQINISKFDMMYFRDSLLKWFFQAKQLKIRWKFSVTENSSYVI